MNGITTIKDVAERAGVSSATVSRVLANKPYVRAEVRSKVLQVAQELNYQPDQSAQRLRSQTTSRLIGLLISGIHNYHFHSIISGVSDLAYFYDLNLMLCNTGGSVEREQDYMDVIQAERALGIIINPQDYLSDGRRLSALRRDGMAVVLIDTGVAHGKFDLVQVDNRQGAFQAVSHLLSLGHRRIGIIAGNLKMTTATERLQGYRDALLAANVPVDPNLIKAGNFEFDSGYQMTLKFIDEPQRPTALFVSNERMMLGALNALNERGMRIPDDMAIIGFDDMEYAAQLRSPLTTIAQPTYEVGKEAVRLLLRRIAEPDAPTVNVTLPTELIVRKSCGA